MELVPAAFVNVVLEHSYEKDCLIIKDKTNGFEYQLSASEMMDCEDPCPGLDHIGRFDSHALPRFLTWFRRNYLKIYAVPKTRPASRSPPWRSPF